MKFTNDLVACELASKIELGMLENKVKDFQTGISKIQKEMAKTKDNIISLKEEIEKLN